jgi:hypothetical protein
MRGNMGGSPIRLGPFAGGLNSLSDPTAVADSELVDVINFELDLDGSLTSRPPIIISGNAPGQIRLLGYVVDTGGTSYLIGSTATATYYFTGGSWTLITSTVGAISMVQFADKAWLLAPVGSANPGGSWVPAGAFTAVSAMPKGKAIVAHKNRLWVAPGKDATSAGSRIRFSSVTDPTSWDVNNYLDVSAGDGQNVTDITVYQNSIMVFKNDSTYNFSYDSSPDRGVVSRISATQGASDINCVVAYENVLFVYHEGNIYELINYSFSRINTKVPFRVDNTVPQTFIIPVAMSLFNDRLIVRHFDRIYTYNLKTRTWTRWASSRVFAYFILEPKNNLITDVPTAYAGSAISGDTALFKIQDIFNLDNVESIQCYVRTKNYDYQISSHFKRLMWWGADVVSQGDVSVIANPIVFSSLITWDQVANAATGWDALQTWDQLLDALPVVTDSIPTVGAGSRKFLKFMKSLRFRQIYFEVTINTDGTVKTAPVKLFNLTTYIATKQQVGKSIS